jgi:hypothetical protein
MHSRTLASKVYTVRALIDCWCCWFCVCGDAGSISPQNAERMPLWQKRAVMRGSRSLTILFGIPCGQMIARRVVLASSTDPSAVRAVGLF